MKKFTIACYWTQYGEFEVEAETLEDAIAKVEAGTESPYDGMPEESMYVDGSFEINQEMTKGLNRETSDTDTPTPTDVGQREPK